jgi:hypothetical protein
MMTMDEVLKFVRSIANHTSGNLHKWYPAEVAEARRIVKEAGGILLARGEYPEGSADKNRCPARHESGAWCCFPKGHAAPHQAHSGDRHYQWEVK